MLEAATGQTLAAYCGDKLWSRLGAERDAYYCLSRTEPRTAIGSGGFNATARDLARVGMLMATPSQGRQIAVVPFTEGTLRLAERLAPRCTLAGIEIALVGSRGEVRDVRPAPAAG